MTPVIRWSLLTVAFCSGMALAAVAHAQSPITPDANVPLSINVCTGAQVPTFAHVKDLAGQPIDDQLQIFCPGRVKPVLTILGCVGPKIKRVGNNYTMTCVSWRGYVSRPQ